MSPLKENIFFYRRVQLILAGSALLALALFYVAAYRPSQAAASDLAIQVNARRSLLADNQSQAGRLPRVQMELDDLKEKLGGFKKLPQHPDFGEFIRQTTDLWQKNSLRKVTWQPENLRKTDLYVEQPVTFHFEGDFANVFSFIRDLEDMPRLTRIHNLDIHSITGHPGVVTVSLTVNFYYASSSTGQGGGQ